MEGSIRFMQEEYFQRQRESLPAFTERTGVPIAIDLLPVDPLWHEARAGIGIPPRWDVLVPDEVIVVENLRRGLVEPLGTRARTDGFDLGAFLPAALDVFRADDEVYAVPYGAMASVLIDRRDLLDRYDLPVPTIWDERRRVALAAQAALRGEGIDDVVEFTSRGLAGYGHNLWIIDSTVFPSSGWTWNRGDGTSPMVDQPATVDALAFHAVLLRDAGPPDAATMTFTDTHARYAEGKAVFLLDAATELATMRRAAATGTGHALDSRSCRPAQAAGPSRVCTRPPSASRSRAGAKTRRGVCWHVSLLPRMYSRMPSTPVTSSRPTSRSSHPPRKPRRAIRPFGTSWPERGPWRGSTDR